MGLNFNDIIKNNSVLNEILHQEEPPVQYYKNPVIIQPRYYKPKLVVWCDLKPDDVDQLNNACTNEEIIKILSQKIELTHDIERDAILLDLFLYVILFCKENCFISTQLSAFFSIIKQTHSICIETPFGNFEQCFTFFKDMLITHSVQRPPFSTDLFDTNQVAKIVKFSVNTYFRHFKLYKYVFTPQVSLNLQFVYEGIPPSPLPTLQDETGNVTHLENEENNAESNTIDNSEKRQSVEFANKNYNTTDAEIKIKNLITQHLATEYNKLKISVYNQLKQTEQDLNKKLQEPMSLIANKTHVVNKEGGDEVKKKKN